MRKVMFAAVLAVMLGLIAVGAESQTATGKALVLSPVSGYQMNGSANTIGYIGVSSSHWIYVTGAGNEQTYSFNATLTWGTALNYGQVTNNAFSVTTNGAGEGNSSHSYQSGTYAVWIGSGMGTARAFATTNPTNAPMGFAKVVGNDYVDFATYGE